LTPRSTRLPWGLSLALALLSPAVAGAAPRNGKLYPTDRCVSDKLRAAAEACEGALEAHAEFQDPQNQALLDAELGRLRVKLAKAFGRAERRVAGDVDCVGTTRSSGEVAEILEDATLVIAAAVGAGLDLDEADDERCGATLLEAAAEACEGLVRASGAHLRHRRADRLRLRLEADQAEALAGFHERFGAARNGCPTKASSLGVAESLLDLDAEVFEAATVSPAVSEGGFEPIFPEEEVSYLGRKLRPICSRGDPYVFFARRGTVNKLVVYYQGGGACWNYLTCRLPTYKVTASATGDDPDNFTTGFADYNDERNPFRDWHAVMVPYCTGDVHWGDATYDYELGSNMLQIEHKGAVNARVVEKWAREHFVAPEQVFVTGSSAGAYGAIASSPYLIEFAWPSSQFAVLGDAGNGVITKDFLVNDLAKWGIEKNIPRFVEALDQPFTETSLADVYVEVARQYPWNRFATYTAAFDGGSGGQTGFYNIMLNGGDPLYSTVWWEGSCAWNAAMRAQNQEMAARAPANLRYYVATGSSHTMWGRDRVYDDTTGGVPTIASWIEAMLEGSPEWVNVECMDCGTTLAGDPRPPALPTAPFDEEGNIVCE
jgi:hypothetical protein